MTDEERDLLIRAAFHELAHAQVARLLGMKVRRIDLRPIYAGAAAYTKLAPHPPATTFERRVNQMVQSLAGYYGEWLIPSDLKAYRSAICDDEKQAARVAESISCLPRAERLDIAAMQAEPFHPGETDADCARSWAKEAAGQEQFQCLNFGHARAKRIVFENEALIRALVPGLLRDRLWTGAMLEQAIAALKKEAP